MNLGSQTALLIDLSTGGVSVRAARPILQHSSLEIRFQLPFTPDWFEAACQIVWWDEASAGLKFVSVGDEPSRRLEAWLSDHLQRLRTASGQLERAIPRQTANALPAESASRYAVAFLLLPLVLVVLFVVRALEKIAKETIDASLARLCRPSRQDTRQKVPALGPSDWVPMNEAELERIFQQLRDTHYAANDKLTALLGYIEINDLEHARQCGEALRHGFARLGRVIALLEP